MPPSLAQLCRDRRDMGLICRHLWSGLWLSNTSLKNRALQTLSILNGLCPEIKWLAMASLTQVSNKVSLPLWKIVGAKAHSKLFASCRARSKGFPLGWRPLSWQKVIYPDEDKLATPETERDGEREGERMHFFPLRGINQSDETLTNFLLPSPV